MSCLESLFPIGLVPLFTVHARKLLIYVWRSQVSVQKMSSRNSWDKFLLWSVDFPMPHNHESPIHYFIGPFDNLELNMQVNSSQEIFSAVASLLSRATTQSHKNRASVSFAKSERGAHKIYDRHKTRIAGGLTYRSTKKLNHTSAN